ncbi:MAG: MGDG synthase family glycosyltransferase [Anaerolineae bacterium]
MSRAGGGHQTAAQSLAEALEGRAQVASISLIDDYAPFPLNQLSASYGPWVTHAPWAYSKVYRLLSSPRSAEMVQRAARPFVRGRVASVLEETAADLVISVHPAQVSIPLFVLREVAGRTPFVTVVTDPVTPPVAWFARDTDLCVVATEQARTVALQSGLSPQRVRVIGLPIRRAFLAARGQPKEGIRAQLGLDPQRRTVLVAGGGDGIGRMLPLARTIADRLANAGNTAQMVVAAGHNRGLLGRLRAHAWPLPVTCLGYVENMADWMAASDILVTKAGPGTLAEAACVGLPAIITEFIPGQEEGNVSWVVDAHAGIFVPEAAQVAETVEYLLHRGNAQLRSMATRALGTSRCDAAERITQAALALCRRQVAV